MSSKGGRRSWRTTGETRGVPTTCPHHHNVIRKAVAASNPNFTDSQLNVAVNVGVAFGAFFALVGLGLWLWMAYANKKGYAWARVVSSVLFGVNTLGLLYVLIAAGSTAIQKVASVAIWLVGLAAIVFLWRSDSSAYFNAP
ncbi:MAG: hypothetical protein E6G66_16015 [Actinobacteria bacterium]|nr:MAG: hypothetical protein E6G66_16015 [Actinomycetota bacterium]